MELFYKVYRTNVEFDEEEKYYYGKIEGIHDLVNFGTDFEDKIVEEFHLAVDDYLIFCDEIGKEPNREAGSDLKLQVNSRMYETLVNSAKNAGESLNELVERILTDYISKTA